MDFDERVLIFDDRGTRGTNKTPLKLVSPL